MRLLVVWNDPFPAEVAEHLVELGNEIVLWAEYRYFKPELDRREMLRRIPRYDIDRVILPRLILENASRTQTVSAAQLNDFAQAEQLYLSISDRFAEKPITVRERRTLLRSLWHEC